MATLALKKAKLIGETPLVELSDKFVVMRQTIKRRSWRFAFYHDTFEDARREASRLAKKESGERFLVLQVVGIQEQAAKVA